MTKDKQPGNDNKEINTGGGVFVDKDVNTSGGPFTGRDSGTITHNTHNHNYSQLWLTLIILVVAVVLGIILIQSQHQAKTDTPTATYVAATTVQATLPINTPLPPTITPTPIPRWIGQINVARFCQTQFDNSFEVVEISKIIVLPSTGWACRSGTKEIQLTPEDLDKACKLQQNDENAFAKNAKNDSWQWQCFTYEKIK